jgi:O-antigen/teichoic acid export membrane protein
MTASQPSIALKSLWTLGTYAASAGIRFGSNIVLSRFLGPEILGVVVIAQAIRTGCDLLTDLGPEQNIVHSRHGDEERFLNTVWTMQIMRGVIVALASMCLAPLLARFYHVDVSILIAISAVPLLNSLMSTSLFSLAKRLDVKTRNIFELVAEALGLVINIALILALRSVWAPILGILLSIAVRSCLTYLLPHPRHRFVLDRSHVRSVLHFSKWILLSSVTLYASVYVDRLFLGRVVTLSTLGIYGLARAIAELPITVAGRVAFQIVFPFVAASENGLVAGSPARAELSRSRRLFLILVVLGIATVMAWSDWAVIVLYGDRYRQAGWMLCLLLTGSWLAVLASLNEATVFGSGKPQNVSLANVIRFAAMAVVIPTGFALFGLPGALLALPAGELTRYLILMRTQLRLQATFIAQDLIFSFGLALVFSAWIFIRMALGLGLPWASMG